MFLVGFTSTRYSTLSQAIIVCNFQKVQTQENGEKPHFVPDLGSLGPNSGCQNSFSNIWPRQSLDIMVSYHHVQYQKQLTIQSWKNLVTARRVDGPDGGTDRQTDRQTDGRTDGRTDESDFIGFCPTNAERPTIKIIVVTKRVN